VLIEMLPFTVAKQRLTREQAERRAQVVQMRRARMSFAEIAEQLAVTPQRVGQLYRDALAQIPRQNVDEHRAEELELIDTAVGALIGIATDSTTSARTRVEAWSAIRGWAERKARLLGLDAPKTHAVLTLDAIDAQIAALEAELGVRAALEEGPGMDD
jgi:hypothetical protein